MSPHFDLGQGAALRKGHHPGAAARSARIAGRLQATGKPEGIIFQKALNSGGFTITCGYKFNHQIWRLAFCQNTKTMKLHFCPFRAQLNCAGN